ncbi:merlin-like [Varroa jacobsoni]|uniref:Moesin/ezrin/radixin homolog 1 n=1 Tax=Varroa destructor TaxID=109461 RepID=A0A7M7KLZ4_VARDE|nr:merlin-like [Varroa destructor]XP_022698610.1 merlin-like [Varroa jacobsoni]
MPLSILGKKASKMEAVRVSTMDAELEFELEQKATGRDLFELVCRTIGLRETWYFGLQFVDAKGFPTWLKLDKRVDRQNCKSPLSFLFLVKFYPEDVCDELIQEVTQHLFFLQVKQAILQQDIYCPPEASVLLASYAVQAKYGDYDETTYTPGMLANDDLLPQRVIDQYQMTLEMWEERIKVWYADHKGMTRNEAEMEYLKIAQDLDMYGVSYFKICNRKDTDLWLGVSAVGLKIYNKDNKLAPIVTFPWSDIRNISFDDKKFNIKPADKNSNNFLFYSSKIRLNKLILDLCMGNHELYMRRRKPDSMEVQQMKAAAKEAKLRRQYERNLLEREKKLREEAERERAELQQRLIICQQEARVAHEALRRSEQTAELLAEKSRIAEEESLLLARKADEAEQQRLRMEGKAREAEVMVMQIAEEKTHEMNALRQELTRLKQAHTAQSQSRAQPAGSTLRIPSSPNTASGAMGPATSSHQQGQGGAGPGTNGSSGAMAPVGAGGFAVGHVSTNHFSNVNNNNISANNNNLEPDEDISALTEEIEREKSSYQAKTSSVQRQLLQLRNEIQDLKKLEHNTPLDQIYEQNQATGADKHATYRKSVQGATKSRVAFFEQL